MFTSNEQNFFSIGFQLDLRHEKLHNYLLAAPHCPHTVNHPAYLSSLFEAEGRQMGTTPSLKVTGSARVMMA